MPIRKILLIDDDPDELEIFRTALDRINPCIEVTQVYSFNEKQPGVPCTIPDLVFLDLNMPKTDGFEWLKKLRSAGYTIPIVMYSTSPNPLTINQAYQQGADLYVVKPLAFQRLISVLQSLLHLDWTVPQTITSLFQRNETYTAFDVTE